MSGAIILYVFAGGLGSGLLGALMGLGGAIVAIPYLNLLLAVPMHAAAACGLVSTLATSCGASGRNLCQSDLVEVDAALLIQLFTAAGSLAGGFLAGVIHGPTLQILFAAMLLYGSVEVGRSLRRRDIDDVLAGPLEAARVQTSLAFFFGAGVVCGLLGVGGGLMVVPLLHLFLRLPFKAAAATSNFMMGLTAIPALIGYIGRGELDLALAIPLAAGVWLGARLGAFLLQQLQSRLLKVMFIGLLVLSAAQMALRGLAGAGG